jgi:AraC-like DNA-binding protein
VTRAVSAPRRNGSQGTHAGVTAPAIVVHSARERVRAMARGAFPRRRGRLVLARTTTDVDATFRTELVDAVLVDLATTSGDAWATAELAREYPSAPFFAVLPLRASDAPSLSRCAQLEFAGVIVEGIDDGSLRDLVAPRAFSARFGRALRLPPSALGLTSELQQRAWQFLVAHSGRPVRTEALASALGVTREHLSRSFADGGAPNLKRVIDFVRVLAAAELAKNPGYDVRDVAAVLGFASSSHLSSTAQRVVGTRPTSLARLRAIDLIERFAKGRSRSRG